MVTGNVPPREGGECPTPGRRVAAWQVKSDTMVLYGMHRTTRFQGSTDDLVMIESDGCRCRRASSHSSLGYCTHHRRPLLKKKTSVGVQLPHPFSSLPSPFLSFLFPSFPPAAKGSRGITSALPSCLAEPGRQTTSDAFGAKMCFW